MGNVFSCVIPPLRHCSRNYDTPQSASQIDGVQDTAAGSVVEPMSLGVRFTVQELPGATNTGLIRNLSPLGFQPLAVHSGGEVTPALSTATTVDDVVSDDEHEDQTSDSKHAQADDNTKGTAHALAVQDISGTASIRNELGDNCLAKSDGDKGKVEDCHSNEDSSSNACPRILVTETEDTVKNTADVEPTSAALEVNNDSVRSNNRQDWASPYSDL